MPQRGLNTNSGACTPAHSCSSQGFLTVSATLASPQHRQEPPSPSPRTATQRPQVETPAQEACKGWQVGRLGEKVKPERTPARLGGGGAASGRTSPSATFSLRTLGVQIGGSLCLRGATSRPAPGLFRKIRWSQGCKLSLSPLWLGAEAGGVRSSGAWVALSSDPLLREPRCSHLPAWAQPPGRAATPWDAPLPRGRRLPRSPQTFSGGAGLALPKRFVSCN